MHLVCMANKPIRVSDEVKKELLAIKKKKELKSVDSVLKRLLKKQAKGDYWNGKSNKSRIRMVWKWWTF